MDADELELLREARDFFSDANSEHSKLPDDYLICECMCVSAKDLRDKYKNNDFNKSTLFEDFRFGSGCSHCLKSLDSWKNKV